RVNAPLPTTVIHAPRLAARAGVDLILASETFQRTGSFKYRAAHRLAASIAQPRVIAASSGNFGQALALAYKLAGKGCTIVMPATSARVKIEAVREHGAHVDLIDVHAISRARRVQELREADPEAYVASAYDDPHVIEGNSTLGEELAALGVDDVVV